jgi:hypothetical protein
MVLAVEPDARAEELDTDDGDDSDDADDEPKVARNAALRCNKTGDWALVVFFADLASRARRAFSAMPCSIAILCVVGLPCRLDGFD